MGDILDKLTFDEWLLWVFDHPENEPGWYFDADEDWWDETASPELTVSYLSNLFENATGLLSQYSDAQVNQGLWFLINNHCSNHMFALLDEQVPWPERQRCIRSFYTLFETFLANRCSPHLSHLDEPGANPINLVCYMWWDIIPFYGGSNDPERSKVDEDLLWVMQMTLELT